MTLNSIDGRAISINCNIKVKLVLEELLIKAAYRRKRPSGRSARKLDGTIPCFSIQTLVRNASGRVGMN